MRMVLAAGAAVLTLAAGAASANPATAGGTLPGPGANTAFLAAAIGAMAACGLVSFALYGRVAERTHVALAMLVVLIGAFALFTMFGLVGDTVPAAGAGVVIGLIALFKLMNQFEIARRREPPPGRRSS